MDSDILGWIVIYTVTAIWVGLLLKITYEVFLCLLWNSGIGSWWLYKRISKRYDISEDI